MYKKVEEVDYNASNPYGTKTLVNVTPLNVLFELMHGRFKVFLEGIHQNDFYKSLSQLMRIMKRIELLENGFKMIREEGDANPFPQYESLATRFEIGPKFYFSLKGFVEVVVSIHTVESNLQSTFFQLKHYGAQQRQIPLWALETHKDNNKITINYRYRDPSSQMLKRIVLAPYIPGKMYEIRVIQNIELGVSLVFLNKKLKVQWVGGPLANFVGNGACVFGLYATDYSDQREELIFKKILVKQWMQQ